MSALEKQLRTKRKKRNQLIVFLSFLLALTIWSAIGTNFNPFELLGGLMEGFRFIFVDLLPPSPAQLPNLLDSALETVYMSFVAMFVGSIIAAVIALFTAATTTPIPFLSPICRAFSALLRNIPVVIWAILLVSSFGLGNMVGTLSLLIVSVGMLVRCFAESLEEIDMNQVEALRAVGASHWQIITGAVLPQFMPSFIGWSLFNLEINIRASTIVGMVGGGGLGFVIQSGIKLFQYQQVSMAIVLVLCIVLCTEWVTGKVRGRLI